MSHNYNASYRDPYLDQGAEYLDDSGKPTLGSRDGSYAQYNAYGAEKTTPDDVDTHVGGTERLQPGRANLGQAPTSSFAAMGPPPRSTGILRMWRKDERGKQWTRGGGARSTGRIVVCCLTITVIIVLSIILTILMFVRPPSIAINSTNVNPATAEFNLDQKHINLDIDIDISVRNPNWFSANFKQITATVKYPGLSGDFGGGSVYNTKFGAYTESTFPFPLSLKYSTANDPTGKMINDIATKCGLQGNQAKGDLTFDYEIKLALKILSISVAPTISGSTSFACPFNAGI